MPTTLDITIHAALSIDLGADTSLICAGTSQTIDAGTGFVYSWSDGSTAQTLSVNQLEHIQLLNRRQWM